MKTIFRFSQQLTYFLFISFFFFASFSKFDNLSVTNTNFEEEVRLAQNLMFTFDKDLVRNGDLNTWQSEL